MMDYLSLRQINVSEHLERKNGLAYLSWAWALDQLLQLDQNACWHYESPMPFGDTLMVFCTVNAFGKTRTAQLPVMDYHNQAIAHPDAFAVNTAMQRCLAKAISLHGIGLYLYAGEDLPQMASSPKKKAVAAPKAPITATAGAMEAFTKEEQELLHLIAEKMTALCINEDLKEASQILESLTNPEKVAVWSLMESKTRGKLKRHLAEA